MRSSSLLFWSSKLKIFFTHAYHNANYLMLLPLILSVAFPHLSAIHLNIKETISHLCSFFSNPVAMFMILVPALMGICRKKKVYLVDFACYNHDPCFLVSREKALAVMSSWATPETVAFTRKVTEKSGVSPNTFIYGCDESSVKSPFTAGMEESHIVISGAVDDLFASTRVDPRDIGVVIVNISTFNPVPSHSAFIVNRYKLRRDVLTYNLGGMGCSAGIIAVDLARRLLQARGVTHALIVSLECPTSSHYLGDDKSKLVPMCLFRMGAAAVLLSTHRRNAKYELKHTLRTHLGADDRAYNCVVQEPDKDGNVGITLSRDLMGVAGDALKANITALGPLVLPLSQQLLYVANLIARKVLKMKGVKPFVPDFKLAFEHFCIHAGGKAVLDEVEKKLKLTEWDMEPARMTLYRYSNTSSSSVWYELAYAEAKGRINKGDRVWQIGFGSGFKCGSAVWKALRTIHPDHHTNPWTPIVHQFPLHI